MRFRFSLTTTLTCLTLAGLMVWASVWQWGRHVEKQALIKTLNATLRSEPTDLPQLASTTTNWETQTWRRVRFSGSYDFAREVIVRRNRGSQDHAGFHVLTPLKLDNSEQYVLVDRGFLPLGREGKEFRGRYHSPARVDAYGLVKQSMPVKFLAPKDAPTGLDKPWVDLWMRVNIENMQQQLPYKVLPIYLEIMENPDDPLLASKIVKQGSAGKNDVLMLTGQENVKNFGMDSPDAAYPIPLFDTTPPPDIHFGYVFEWAFMALLTLGIGFVLQLRRAP